jgi:hypothetical protein
VEGLGLVPGRVTAFDAAAGLPVPHIGWNDLLQRCAARPGAPPAGAPHRTPAARRASACRGARRRSARLSGRCFAVMLPAGRSLIRDTQRDVPRALPGRPRGCWSRSGTGASTSCTRSARCPSQPTRTGCSPRPSTAASLCPRSSAARCPPVRGLPCARCCWVAGCGSTM